MTSAECAQRSGFSVKTVYRAIHSGALEASQPTAHYRIRKDAFERWVSSRRKAPGSANDAPVVVPVAPPERGSSDELRAIEREAA